jgi:hypothetical protein
MLEDITRRNFLRIAGLGGLGLAAGLGTSGCASFPKDVNWASVPDNEFTLEKFDDFFTRHKLYNGVGRGNRGAGPTFSFSLSVGVTPGFDFSSNSMYAVADGVVIDIHELNTGRLGGSIMYIAHTDENDNMIFISSYGHLGTILVDEEKVRAHEFVKVNRGQEIAKVKYFNHAKLMLTRDRNYVDPDNYGEGHSYMNYRSESKNSNIAGKDIRQQQIVFELMTNTTSEVISKLTKRNHSAYSGIYCNWDVVEKFRYLDCLFDARPQFFPKLSPDKFAEYKKEFYANQPIILTLPLKQ